MRGGPNGGGGGSIATAARRVQNIWKKAREKKNEEPFLAGVLFYFFPTMKYVITEKKANQFISSHYLGVSLN